MSAPPLPVFLRLDGRPCLVAGGGKVAWRKTRQLRACGARVTLVAPEIAPAPEDLRADPEIRCLRRPFDPADADGQMLIVAATDDPRVQEDVSCAARERGVPCNVVDRPGLCDLFFGAILRRGDLQIAVSTSGRFPLLASRLRDRLAAAVSPGAAQACRRLARERNRIRSPNGIEPRERRRILEDLLTPEVLETVTAGDLPALEERIQAWNSSPAR